ncbi:MAG: glycosyltransferase family 39 protein [Actinomycetes bacterium]
MGEGASRRRLRTDAAGLVRRTPTGVLLAAIVACSTLIADGIAHQVVAPWIMIDELIWSDLARGFADNGHLLIRGGTGVDVGPLYPMLLSVSYRLFAGVPDAYAAAKGINAFAMSLAAIPAYLLARRVVSRRLALVAAVLTVAVPSMAYTGVLMTENLFYPLFLLVVLALVRVLEHPTRTRQVVLLAAIGVAYETRVQAIGFLGAAVLAPPLLLWYRRASLRGIAAWWFMYGLLATAVVGYYVVQQVRGQRQLGSYQGVASDHYSPGVVLKWIAYHVGEIALYVGVIPLVAFVVLALLGRRLPEPLRVFMAAAVTVTVVFVLEVATFASLPDVSRIEERNLFYVVPLFLIALLAWIETGLPRRWPVVVVAGAAVALVAVVPYRDLINGNASADTLAFLPLWTLQDTVITLGQVRAVVVIAAALLAVAFLLVPARWALALPAVVAVWFGFTLWTVERNAHGGWRHNSVNALFGGTTNPRPDWIDRAVGTTADVTVVWWGDTNDPFLLWTNEFFNRSVHRVYELDTVTGAPGRLPATTVHIDPASGELLGAGSADYVFTSAAVQVAGAVVAQDVARRLVLLRIEGPVRIAATSTGIYPDTWSGPDVTYTRYRCAGGTVKVFVQQDPSLFPESQVVRVGGRSFGVHGSRWITVPVVGNGRRCETRYTVSPTRVPGHGDLRRLGIHFSRFTFSAGG